LRQPNTYSYAYSYGNADGNLYAYSYGNADGNLHAYGNGNGYGYVDAYCDCVAKVHADAKATANAVPTISFNA
jgi:hypothetical protein